MRRKKAELAHKIESSRHGPSVLVKRGNRQFELNALNAVQDLSCAGNDLALMSLGIVFEKQAFACDLAVELVEPAKHDHFLRQAFCIPVKSERSIGQILQRAE